ncbi:pantothenate kinase [Parvibaculum lavamentivorans DS-1]|uniref:Pantothenate kinase n=1 Tax=Parvibaculum lavamentivorans (strain DS-1 / DSM 13023 / NCIMB 13966) TaxID=402881 RepID=COAA_PARL1|nr:type I pantothenate kinase [Parvibaculum lavamentivorans]A7HSG6.1 RecName: Full=Pantothenate kinase; AltName: Full=Pantothenic acid kinase [Parvibaculum lavamentivorans DS-1]ABS62849.1 pantothenate kinase [Parvibaculum lavamentivorans DS-1]
MGDDALTADSGRDETQSLSPFRYFTAAEWGRLRQDTPLPLSQGELEELKGFGERISLDEVSEIYLPLSRLLNLYVGETQELYRVTSDFLGREQDKVPYIIGVAGSVAVGKSTTARILRTLLARWPNHPKVDLITTDGFLYPNKVLEERGLMQRKGFPESFDIKRLLRFLSDVKAGSRHVEAPVYSHFTYDILPGETIPVDYPDILVVEGLNVLQPWKPADGDEPQPFVSDFFDFSIYLDADEASIRRWYIERFLSLRRTSFKDPAAYFHRYSKLTEEEAVETADAIWTSINLANLRKNILPTRQRADLILRKGDDHRIRDVLLRKL